MSRIVKAPDIRKQELIDIALKQFLENGYEKTSVRSILKEVDGEIGMFYHYFKSKKEIYEAVLEYFNEAYITQLAQFMESSQLRFEEKVDQILLRMPESLLEYRRMYAKNIDLEMITILHSRTLTKMVPLFEEMILEGIKKKHIHAPIPNVHLLSQFILFGISAILHDSEISSTEEKRQHIKVLIAKIFDMKKNEV